MSAMPPVAAAANAPVRRSPLVHALARAGRGLWRALEAHGQSRARRELLAFADRWEHQQPELAKALRHAARHDAAA